MKTYTANLTPPAVIEAALPQKYPMELNRSDMLRLLEALKFCDESGDGEEDGLGDWAGSLRRSILETIDIEEV